MCGIAGLYGKRDPERLWSMLLRIRHRGPDDLGEYHRPDVSLGHARLSIVDLAGGRQPLHNEDGAVTVVFNGEIYNHQALRAKLAQAHRFTTHTDTEVIVHLYEELGERCVEELDGMFAFAVYDAKKEPGQRIFLARDRLGIKPLYLERAKAAWVFASELKAMPRPERAELFPPGHTFTPAGGFCPFFALPEGATAGSPAPPSEDQIQQSLELLRQNLERAVVKRLMSDVPVGVFLSGGLDSSLVAALAKRHLPRLYTFAVGMAGAPDLVHAREAASYLGTDHHEQVYTEQELRDAFHQVVYYLESFDAPLLRSAFPCYFVSRLARQHGVKVILTGEGADELFSGYRYLKELPNRADLSVELREITGRLHSTNLQRVDRMSMAWGIECRVPFLDVDFLRLAFALDPGLKLAHGGRPEKWLLRQAFQGYLPESVLHRRKEKFSAGAGSRDLTSRLAEELLPDLPAVPGEGQAPVRTREELCYYRLFRRFYPAEAIRCVGQTKSYPAEEDTGLPSPG